MKMHHVVFGVQDFTQLLMFKPWPAGLLRNQRRKHTQAAMQCVSADFVRIGLGLRDGAAPQVVSICAMNNIDLVTPSCQRLADHLCEDCITAEVIGWIKSRYMTEPHTMEQYNEQTGCGEIIALRIYDIEAFEAKEKDL